MSERGYIDSLQYTPPSNSVYVGCLIVSALFYQSVNSEITSNYYATSAGLYIIGVFIYMLKISHIFVVLLAFTIVRAVVFNKEVNSADPQALCINGAQSFFYSNNFSTSADKIIIYFMQDPQTTFCGGQSLSQSLDKCYNSYDYISNYWGNQLNITSGILADPVHDNWAKVIIPNCDATLFQGYAKSQSSYKGKKFYFRGSKVVKSNLDHIFNKKFNASKITQFVFAGSGYAAIGALVWSRYFYDEVVLSSGKNKHFQLILDAMPFSFQNFVSKTNLYELSLEYMVKIANQDELPPFILCTLRNQGQEWRCFKLEETYYYLSFPVLLIDSQYDLISIEDIMQIRCVNSTTGSLSQCSQAQRNHIENYRSSKLVKLYRFVNFHDNSAWSISCSTKQFLNSNIYNSASWSVGGTTASQGVSSFLSQSRVTNFNYMTWPSNEGCSGTNSASSTKQ